jgi:hypothetical protein
MMSAVSSPVSMMAARRLGEAIWVHDGSKLSCALRAESAWIQALGLGAEAQCAKMLVEIPVQHAPILLWVVTFRLSQAHVPETSVFFASYVNAGQVDQGIAYAHQLTQQDQLVLNVYGDDGTRERSLSIPNLIRTSAEAMPRLLGAYPRWTPEGFTQACARLEVRYPTPRDLWDLTVAEEAKKGRGK